MKRKEEQLDLFGSESIPTPKKPAPPKEAKRTARHTKELFDDFELLPSSKR